MAKERKVQIRFRSNLPYSSYLRLKDLKRRFNLDYSQIAQVLLVRELEKENLTL